MRVLLTGSAGFIGGRLAHRLLDAAHTVIGVDSFTDYYDVAIKRRVSAALEARAGFELRELDLARDDLGPLVEGADVIIHLAAQPGVRLSWSDQFAVYLERNVFATQRLLEAASARPDVPVLFASSSSVYGDVATYPTRESDTLQPRSPYGVTKVAAERIAYSYAATHGMRTVAMRFFTVYGPGQRPDMATHRLISAALDGSTFALFGDGTQLRDFTFVDDVVDAIELLAHHNTPVGMTPLNIGGTGETSMLDLIALIERSAGRSITIDQRPVQAGDVRRTGADISAISSWVGWSPRTSLAEGIDQHVAALRAAGAR